MLRTLPTGRARRTLTWALLALGLATRLIAGGTPLTPVACFRGTASTLATVHRRARTAMLVKQGGQGRTGCLTLLRGKNTVAISVKMFEQNSLHALTISLRLGKLLLVQLAVAILVEHRQHTGTHRGTILTRTTLLSRTTTLEGLEILARRLTLLRRQNAISVFVKLLHQRFAHCGRRRHWGLGFRTCGVSQHGGHAGKTCAHC